MNENVCTLKQAWQFYDTILGDERFDYSPEPEGLELFLREYTSTERTSPKLWQDAYLAAFARTAKLRLVTFDQGFKQFNGLKITVLQT
jgi:predicted nucleic acid-binding protein